MSNRVSGSELNESMITAKLTQYKTSRTTEGYRCKRWYISEIMNPIMNGIKDIPAIPKS